MRDDANLRLSTESFAKTHKVGISGLRNLICNVNNLNIYERGVYESSDLIHI